MTAEIARLVAPTGGALGVDVSHAFVNHASANHHQRGLRFVQGAAESIPSALHSVDAVYVERVFQHLAAPEHALAEIQRVLRPGGRCLVVETDWDSLDLDHPDRGRTEDVKASWRAAIRNPRIAADLVVMAARFGLQSTTLDAITVRTTNLDETEAWFPLRRSTELAIHHGRLDPDESTRWARQFAEGSGAACVDRKLFLFRSGDGG